MGAIVHAYELDDECDAGSWMSANASANSEPAARTDCVQDPSAEGYSAMCTVSVRNPSAEHYCPEIAAWRMLNTLKARR